VVVLSVVWKEIGSRDAVSGTSWALVILTTIFEPIMDQDLESGEEFLKTI